jgi:hypothetical protein
MFSITRDFAPPFKLIVPYFIIGTVVFLFSTLLLLGFDINQISYLDSSVLSWVHLFLLGFVMMIIFGAMAQLIPVVLEVGHWAVELFYVIWPLLLIGTLMMVFGFYVNVAVLPYGGTFVLIAMAMFTLNVFVTLKKVETFSLVVKCVIVSNIFLLLGLIIGIVMALSFAGTISVDVMALLKAHVYLIVGGYVGVTIMGLSLVLLPMFGLSHNFSQTPITVAVYMLSTGIIIVTLSALFDLELIKYVGYIISIASFILYFYQIVLIYKTRARKENDIWVKSMFFAYGSLIFSLIFGFVYLLNPIDSLILGSGWLFSVGFIGFIISGHLYKIVPFLVWFERFSPLVGKKKVPMLADMVPNKSATYQLVFSSAGVIICTFGLLFSDDTIFKAGASFLVIGAFYLTHSLFYMTGLKAEE